jgi:hypothetical protein
VGLPMKKGVVFSIETLYAMVAVFALIVGMIVFLHHVKQPEYDFISTLKVAHDFGNAQTEGVASPGLPGEDFETSCSGKEVVANLSYYNQGVVCRK